LGKTRSASIAIGALGTLGLTAGHAIAGPVSLSCESVGQGSISPSQLCDILADELKHAFPGTALSADNGATRLHLFLHVNGPVGPRLEGTLNWKRDASGAGDPGTGTPVINMTADREVGPQSYRALVRELIRVNGPEFMGGEFMGPEIINGN
jgi:hypothetical protein